MELTGYELLWLFLAYSFLGWVLETVFAALRQKKFVNRGLVNGPFCTLYGSGAVLIQVFCSELQGVWLFLGTAILATVLEWTAGHLIERMYHERWWDYSKSRWNLDGYICLEASLVWGLLGCAGMRWGNSLLNMLFHILPQALGNILVLVAAGLLAVDVLATLVIISGKSGRLERWKDIDSGFTKVTLRLGRKIEGSVQRRITRAYDVAPAREKEETIPGVFASGCGFYKLVWLFVIGSFLGDVVETIFCRLTAGVWMSRSSLVWGAFSIVWGLAIAAVTQLLYRYRDRSESFLFMSGVFLGGAYEYICSVFTELVFGKVFWDYSSIPFNLGGRINLLYCFFWGIAAVVWLKRCYPILSGWIEKWPVRLGKLLTWFAVVFMCCNIIVSCMALVRSDQRCQGIPATQGWQQAMDSHYDDETMERIYPNAKSAQ